MALALTDAYIKNFIRDEKAWKRALNREDEDGLTGLCANEYYDFLRRGSADNRASICFNNQLRRYNPVEPCDKKWCSDPKVSNPPDSLKLLLRKNLRKHGYLEASHQAVHQLRERKEHTTRSRETKSKAAIEGLLRDEVTQRRGIVLEEKSSRKELNHLSFLDSVNILLDLEYAGRREIFRDWINEMLDVQKEEEYYFSLITGASHATFKKIDALLGMEQSRRQSIYNLEKKEAVKLSKYALLFRLEVIEKSIERKKTTTISKRQTTS